MKTLQMWLGWLILLGAGTLVLANPTAVAKVLQSGGQFISSTESTAIGRGA